MDDSQRILEAAKREGQKWLDSFKPDGNPDRDKIIEELSKRTFEGEPIVVRLVDSPEKVVPAIIELIKLGEDPMTDEEVKRRLSDLKPWECIWDYYLMAFYESAYKQCPDQSHEFGSQSFLEAFKAGLGFIINLGTAMVGVCLPEAHRDPGLRIHRENGPAIVWGDEKQYWWHGTQIEAEWIEDKENINPHLCLTEPNIEKRRALCEIVGWDKVLEQLDAKVIDTDPDPEIGILLEVDLPDSGKERFLKVRCGTGRDFVLPVEPTLKTAHEANAWTYGIEDVSIFNPEVRT